jgi:hypothetical protein
MKYPDPLEKKNIRKCCDHVKDHDNPNHFAGRFPSNYQADNEKEETQHQRRIKIIDDQIVPVNGRKIVPRYFYADGQEKKRRKKLQIKIRFLLIYKQARQKAG